MSVKKGCGGERTSEPARFMCMGPFTLDLQMRHTILNDKVVPIPPCSFDILVVLMRHAPEAVSYKALVAEASHQKLGELEAQDLARLNIYMLRRVLESNMNAPRYIKTVAGYGYKLTV